MTELKIVAIGASAGGLEAIRDFFDHMPSGYDMAFVIIQHLSPDFKSLMTELLTRNTKMPVVTAEEHMLIEADKVFLIPPSHNMFVDGDYLKLVKQDRGHNVSQLPIDLFFESLAQNYPGRSAGIILSGTGSDGSKGITALAAANSLIMVQDPAEAKFDGMPKSAIATAKIDCVIPVKEMPEALICYQKNRERFDQEYAINHFVKSTKFYNLVLDTLAEKHKIDFSLYKHGTIGRRITRRMQMLQIREQDDFLRLLQHDDTLKKQLLHDILIGVTSFFRDSDAFNYLKTVVVPDVLSQLSSKQPECRIWITACSTGEEAYSLAMIFLEGALKLPFPVEFKIFVTDVNTHSLDKASRGVYSAEDLKQVDDYYKERYFTANNEGFQVSSLLRKIVVFAPHNLISDPPFTNMHFVSCRNFLIYIKPEIQQLALDSISFALRLQGCLFLGSSESLGDLASHFDVLHHNFKVFRKILTAPQRMNLDNTTWSKEPISHAQRIQYENRNLTLNKQSGVRKVAPEDYGILLGQQVKNGFLLDATFDILHVFGDAGKFLCIPEGPLGNNLISMVVELLQVPLILALNTASNERKNLEYKDIIIDSDTSYTLRVSPLCDKRGAPKYFIVEAILGGREEGAGHSFESEKYNPQVVDERAVQELQKQLQETKESLQEAIEISESTNQELQSSNEELLASNEELQSTNEELNSVNEELYTVNSEHKNKIQDLTQLNNDMSNLLESSDIATIFIDLDLCIRRYTPAVEKIFKFFPQDIGRSMLDFNTIQLEGLAGKFHTVIETLKPIDVNVMTVNGKVFLLKIFPYMTDRKECDGVVLNFIDIDDIKDAALQFESAVNVSPIPILIVDKGGVITYVNMSGYTLFNGEASDLLGVELYNFVEVLSQNDFAKNFSQLILGGARVNSMRLSMLNAQGESFSASISLAAVNIERQKKFVCMVSDLTQQLEAEKILMDSNAYLEQQIEERTRALDESKKRMALLFDHSPDSYFSFDQRGQITECNQTAVQKLGYEKKSEIVGRNILSLYSGESQEKALNGYNIFLNSGKLDNVELKVNCRDGGVIYVMLKMVSVRDERGEVIYRLCSWRDVTELKQLEEEARSLRLSSTLFKEHEKLYQTILNEVSDGWWDWNLETNEEYMSPSFKALFGYRDDEIENHVNGWRKLIFQEDFEKALRAFERHIRLGEPYSLPVRYRHKDGHTVWVLCRGHAIQDEDGEYRRMVGTHTDITQIKSSEFMPELDANNLTDEDEVL